jgi:CoA binding domain
VLQNLVEGGFAGPIMPVNPKHDVLAGIKVHPTVASLPAIPELAVICTPPATVPDLIGELGARGTKAHRLLPQSWNQGACRGSTGGQRAPPRLGSTFRLRGDRFAGDTHDKLEVGLGGVGPANLSAWIDEPPNLIDMATSRGTKIQIGSGKS